MTKIIHDLVRLIAEKIIDWAHGVVSSGTKEPGRKDYMAWICRGLIFVLILVFLPPVLAELRALIEVLQSSPVVLSLLNLITVA